MTPAGKSAAISTGAASTGISGAVTALVVWFLGLLGVTMPADVAAALMVVVTPILHGALVKWGVPLDVPPPVTNTGTATP